MSGLWEWKEDAVVSLGNKANVLVGGEPNTAGQDLDGFLWPPGAKAESNIEFYDL